MAKPVRKVILIDDDWGKGWAAVFEAIFNDIYQGLITFETLKDISNDGILRCYKNNPDALFIQDNELGKDVMDGLEWIKSWGRDRAIILHSGDNNPQLGFLAANAGARGYIRKEDPQNPMSFEDFRDQYRNMHVILIKHFNLAYGFIWIVDLKMSMVVKGE